MIRVLLTGAMVATAPAIAGLSEYRSVPSTGLEVSYREAGQGAPILVLGGGPGDVSDRYVDLCEGLAKSHRCILVDQRGTGRSRPPTVDASSVTVALTLEDFEAIRRSLGLSRWTVLGFSYGGYLASLYAHHHPESVSRLVLLGSMGLNADAFPHFNDNIVSRLRPSDLELVSYWSDPARNSADPKRALVERIRARMPGYFFDRAKSLAVSQSMKESDFDFEMGALIWKDVESRNLDLARMDPAYAGPVLVVHGRQDPLGESVPLGLARYYRDSRLVIVEKCGHYSWIEQPEKVFSAISEFLAGPDR